MVLAQDVLPQTGDQWAFAGALLTVVSTGIGFLFKSLLGAKDAHIADLKAQITEAKQERRDDREASNRRLDAATEAISKGSIITAELVSVVRANSEHDGRSLEEQRRLSANIEAMLREYGRRGAHG